MATAPTYNKPVTCLCDNLAEYHCNTCGDTLCSKCKATHQRSKATSHHSVVPYRERLRPEHLSSFSCPDHKGKDCTFWCEECSKATCIDCVITTHQSHTFISLEAILKQKTTILRRELESLECNELKEWKALATEAKQMTSDYLDHVNGVGKELDARAKEFHAKVDEIFNATKKQLEDMKKTSLAVLHQQVKMVSNGLERVKQKIRECEEKLRNGSTDSLLQYEEIQEREKAPLPKISPVMPPTFTLSQIDKQSLSEMFGKLTEQQVKDGKPKTEAAPKDTPKSTDKDNAATPKTAGGESKWTPQGYKQISTKVKVPTLPQRRLISTPSLQSSFKTQYNSYDQSIACVG